MKRVIKLQHYFAPSELKEAIGEWVQYCNEQRYHEELDNLNISGQVGTNPQYEKIAKKHTANQRH